MERGTPGVVGTILVIWEGDRPPGGRGNGGDEWTVLMPVWCAHLAEVVSLR